MSERLPEQGEATVSALSPKYVSRWKGTMNVISTFAPSRAMHHGRRGSSREWDHREFERQGLSGTLIHLTLNVIKHEASDSSATLQREPAAV